MGRDDLATADRRHDHTLAAARAALAAACRDDSDAAALLAARAALRQVATVRAGLGVPVPAAVRSREQEAARVLEQTVLPTLARQVVAAAPVPGEPLSPTARRGVFLDRATLLAEASAGEPLVGRPLEQAAVRQAVASLAHMVRFFYRGAFDALQGPDHPDLAGLSADLFRADLIQEALAILGGEAERTALQTEIGVLSREALRRTTAVVQDFLACRTPDTRLSLAAVLQSVEDLIVLVDRVQAAGDASAAGFGLGDAAIMAFLDACAPLVAAISLDLRDRMAAGAVSPAAARGNLGQILRILRFCHAIRHPLGRQAVMRVAEALPGLVAGTVSRVAAEAAQRRALAEVLEEFVQEAAPLLKA